MAQTNSKKSWPLLAWLVNFGLVIGILWCIYQIFAYREAALARAEAEHGHLLSLEARQTELHRLINLSPCEAKQSLGQTSGLAPASEPQPAPVSVATAAASPEDIEKACVFIVSPEGPNSVNTGSGFFVDSRHVLTNRHVVKNSPDKILVTSHALGRPVLGHVSAIGPDEGRDYALIELEPPANADIKIMAFGADPKKTDKAGAWGFPDLVGKADPQYARLMAGEISAVPVLSYSEGVISAVLPRDPEIIVHTAPISPGNSGGPLVDSQGNVIGINTMITLDEDTYRQASLAIAARDLHNFLTNNGIKPLEN